MDVHSTAFQVPCNPFFLIIYDERFISDQFHRIFTLIDQKTIIFRTILF